LEHGQGEGFAQEERETLRELRPSYRQPSAFQKVPVKRYSFALCLPTRWFRAHFDWTWRMSSPSTAILALEDVRIMTAPWHWELSSRAPLVICITAPSGAGI
jgi:hypothetical protein